MACGYEVVVVAALGIESTELDESVAHDIGIGSESRPYLFHGVLRHLVPVFLMAVNDFKVATVFPGHRCGHLEVFLRVAVPFLLFLGTNLYVETVGMKTALRQFVNDDGAVDTTRKEYGDTGFREVVALSDGG